MNKIKNIMKDYFIENRKLLITYSIITLVFYLINLLFFSRSIDLPPDIIFIIIYIIFSPGILIIFTMYRSNVVLIESKATFFYTVIIHSISVILFNFIVLNLYKIFRVHLDYWEDFGFWTLIISIPVMLIGMIIAIECKIRFRKFYIKIILFGIYLVSFYLLEVEFNTLHTYKVLWVVYPIYLFIIPVLTIVFYYRKKLLDIR